LVVCDIRGEGLSVSSAPPFSRYVVMPVARKLWRHAEVGQTGSLGATLDHVQHAEPIAPTRANQ